MRMDRSSFFIYFPPPSLIPFPLTPPPPHPSLSPYFVSSLRTLPPSCTGTSPLSLPSCSAPWPATTHTSSSMWPHPPWQDPAAPARRQGILHGGRGVGGGRPLRSSSSPCTQSKLPPRLFLLLLPRPLPLPLLLLLCRQGQQQQHLLVGVVGVRRLQDWGGKEQRKGPQSGA